MATSLKAPFLSSGEAEDSHPRPTRNLFSPKITYKTTCVTTKESLLILLWSMVINTVGFSPVLLIISTPYFVRFQIGVVPVLVYYMLGLLMYPLAGFVGDALVARFKLLTAGSVMILVGGIIYAGYAYFLIGHGKYYLFFLPLLLSVPGFGLFQANVLQYGIDQLDFANSEVISSFVYWYYWTCYIILGIYSQALYWASLSAESLIAVYIALSLAILAALVFLSVTIACCIGCCCYCRSLRLSLGHRVNPLKLIWRVMRFVSKHKHPVRRSAFTYDEWPSRLDLGKQRYGGPFTTEEVEDVKSFWQILLLLVSLVGLQFYDNTSYIATAFDAVASAENIENLGFDCTWSIGAVVVVVTIPIYQFIVRPCFPACIAKMVTKMFIGLLVIFVSLSLTTAYSWMLTSSTNVYQNVTICNATTNYCDPNTTTTVDTSLCSLVTEQAYFSPTGIPQPDEYESYAYFVENSSFIPSTYWLAIPQALNGLGHVLVFLTALEFIVAQAPCVFRGFLIGLWYAMQSINLGIAVIGYLSCAVFYWEYYLAKTVIVLLSVVLFVVTAHKYKYRQLNEDADVNVQQQIEEVFERNFERELEYEEELQKEEQQYAYRIVDSYGACTHKCP